MRGRTRCESTAARPRPGKCFRQPATPNAFNPSRNAAAAAAACPGSADAARPARIALPAPSTARSTTGARSQSIENAAQISPASAPARPASPAAQAPSNAGDRPVIARKRSTGPPSWSTQRIAPGSSLLRSATSSRSWSSAAMFRENRRTAPGGCARKTSRSRGESEGPAIPTTKRPDAFSGALSPGAWPGATARRPA
jgi:hypothetical protein